MWQHLYICFMVCLFPSVWFVIHGKRAGVKWQTMKSNFQNTYNWWFLKPNQDGLHKYSIVRYRWSVYLYICICIHLKQRNKISSCLSLWNSRILQQTEKYMIKDSRCYFPPSILRKILFFKKVTCSPWWQNLISTWVWEAAWSLCVSSSPPLSCRYKEFQAK